MNPLETLRAAVMALRDHKLRSGLTALGIIIGTSATIAMLAIGAGARAQVAAQVQSLGSNLLIVVSGNVNQSGVRLGAGATPTLTDEDAATIGQEIPSVQVTSSLISGKIQVVAEAANWATNVATVDPGYFEVRDWAVESGRAFEADEAKNGAQVALLGQTVAKQLFPDVDPIGREVRIKNVPFRVIGMLAKKGQSTAGQDQDDALIVPLNAGRRVLGQQSGKVAVGRRDPGKGARWREHGASKRRCGGAACASDIDYCRFRTTTSQYGICRRLPPPKKPAPEHCPSFLHRSRLFRS